MDGFYVDLRALSHASDGIRRTVETVHGRRVGDLACSDSAFGHDRLASTVAEFCDRWSDGVGHLCDDAREVSERLDHCLQAYREAEHAAQSQVEGVLDHTAGPHPSAQ